MSPRSLPVMPIGPVPPAASDPSRIRAEAAGGIIAPDPTMGADEHADDDTGFAPAPPPAVPGSSSNIPRRSAA